MTTCAEIPAPNGAKHQGRIPAVQDEAEWQSGLRDKPPARVEFGLTDHGLPTSARMPRRGGRMAWRDGGRAVQATRRLQRVLWLAEADAVSRRGRRRRKIVTVPLPDTPEAARSSPSAADSATRSA
jgi:hypothetical protein